MRSASRPERSGEWSTAASSGPSDPDQAVASSSSSTRSERSLSSTTMRGHNEGSLFRRQKRRSDGSTYVLHVAKVSLPDGRRLERSSTDPKKAARYLRDMNRQLGRGVEPRHRLTLGDFLAGWLIDVQAHVKPQTWRRYRSITNVHLIPDLGDVALQALRASRVDAFLATKEGRTGAMCREVLRNALNAALRDGLVEHNAAERSRPVDYDETPATILSLDEWRRFLDGIAGDRLEALWTLAAMTAMREGELLGLAWDDVDLDNGQLLVRQQLVRLNGDRATHTPGEWVLASPKTKKGTRLIQLNAVVVAALRDHKVRMAAERKPGWKYFGLVFVTEDGMPFYGYRVVALLRAHLARLGIEKPRLKLHELRHTVTSFLAADGLPDAALADLLGQAQLVRRYVHGLPEHQREIADRMEAMRGG